ncbi:MAG: S8 family serine peptidase [Prevotella sp.]|nr:S8 family serine peptidase [Paraprevotella sp.]MDD7692269.1 S8 family serine peptidase [Prevotella sp.]
MKKTLFILFYFLLVACCAIAKQEEPAKIKYPGGKTFLFRLKFVDKVGCQFNINQADSFLSSKAIERRRKQHLPIDSTDLPISRIYIERIKTAGFDVVSMSKWNNTILVRTHTEKLKPIENLPFVKEIKKVWTSPDSIVESPTRLRYHNELKTWDEDVQDNYGVAKGQIDMLSGIYLHSRGLTGRGKTIAVLDGGFMNVDLIPCFQSINILGWKDFVVPQAKSLFREMEHGTKVLSVMGVNVPGTFVGTAPDAAYWLLRCEDNLTESLAEEDYWAAAVEFADSVGVDVISSSLGYHSFDSKGDNYSYAHLDGHTALISKTASMLANKGIVLVNSAGNDGMGTWKKINVPADAYDILTVGAVTPDCRNAAFSSIGPTADGRVKPDVMALGSPTAVITGRGTIIKDIGTSFSTPIVSGLVACLWQACPSLTAKEIINLVRQCSDNTSSPDNIYGYGIPNFRKALKK